MKSGEGNAATREISMPDYEGSGGHASYINSTIKATDSENLPRIILEGATFSTVDDNTGIGIRAEKLTISNSAIAGGSGEYTGSPNGNWVTSRLMLLWHWHSTRHNCLWRSQ